MPGIFGLLVKREQYFTPTRLSEVKANPFAVVAEEQRRLGEAEAHYRRALGIYDEFNDWHTASMTTSRLGIVLALLGRHVDSVQTLLPAAVSWHQLTGAGTLTA